MTADLKRQPASGKFFLGVALVLSLTIGVIFLLPFCGWMYQCGCTYWWAEGYDLCNIHQTALPHCPWCVARSPALMTLPFLLVLGGQGGAIIYSHRRFNLSVIMLVLVGLLTFFILATLHGYVFKLLDRYPYFFAR